MKLCSQCGYYNGDYMDTCVQCGTHLNPITNSQNIPYGVGSYPTIPEISDATTNYQAIPTQAYQSGQSPYIQNYPYPPVAQANIPTQSPFNPVAQSYPVQFVQPQIPTQFQQPQTVNPIQTQIPPQLQQPQIMNPAQTSMFYSTEPYAYDITPDLGDENNMSSKLDGFSETFHDEEKPKRSHAGLIIGILVALLVFAAALLYFLNSNGLLPNSAGQTADSNVSSASNTSGDSVDNDSAQEDQNAYDTMISLVRNTANITDEQAKAIVDILLDKCCATNINAFSSYNEPDSYKLDTTEGTCIVKLDPSTKALADVVTLETTPRYIYQNGTPLASIKDMCVSHEEINALKPHAQKRMESYLPEENIYDFIFAEDDEWEFHKEDNWVVICSYVSPKPGSTYTERIPFYFEYEFKMKNDQPSYTLKYAMVGEKSTGDCHFSGRTNPFDPQKHLSGQVTPTPDSGPSTSPASEPNTASNIPASSLPNG